MLSRLLKFLIGLPLTLILLGFVVLNRQDVMLHISPLHDPVTLPIMWVGLLCVCFGFVAGAVLVWAEGGATRRQNRQLTKQVKQLQKQLSAKTSLPQVTNNKDDDE